MFSQTHQIILKVTKGCNLACKYCYVFDKPELNDFEMLDETFDFIMRRWMSETQKVSLSLIFHGGEPLRIGKQKFSRFCKKAMQYAVMYDKSLSFGVQTNSTLIDSDWLALFRAYGIIPGISWDGLYSNIDHRNNTHDLTLQKIKECVKAGVVPGIISVVHQGNYNTLKDSYKVLLENGIYDLKANRGVDTVIAKQEDSSFECTAEQLIETFNDAIDFMREHPEFSESNTYELLHKWFSHPEQSVVEYYPYSQAHCESLYCGGLRNLIEIDPDGSINFCGRLSGSVKDKIATVGTVFDRDPFEMTLIQTQLAMQTPKKASIDAMRCSECFAQSICDHGCISYSLTKLGEPILDNQTHTYFRKLAIYLIENHEKVWDVYIKRRNINNERHSHECM